LCHRIDDAGLELIFIKWPVDHGRNLLDEPARPGELMSDLPEFPVR
jgi:hypothetical protein